MIRYAQRHPQRYPGCEQLRTGLFPLEDDGWFDMPEAVVEIERRTLMARLERPKELTGPVVFLALVAVSYVTGDIIYVDRSWTAWYGHPAFADGQRAHGNQSSRQATGVHVNLAWSRFPHQHCPYRTHTMRVVWCFLSRTMNA